jgi:hypothetical protein
MKGVHATEKDFRSEDSQTADHRESQEGDKGIAAAASSWKDRLSELANYHKIHLHCNVRKNYSENTKLGSWVSTQRKEYKMQQEGKISPMTLSRIQELESLGFEWDICGTIWEERLSELTDYRKIHGHCNVPRFYSENVKLATWVKFQRSTYKLKVEGRTSSMTLSRIQALERLGFQWDCYGAAWEERLSELADYRKIHGNCNVPTRCSENTQLAKWVENQRYRHSLQEEGKPSSMTPSRIQELENLGFEWDLSGAAWEGRLSELADYRKIHGHCNVPSFYSKNTKLAYWVRKQREQHKLHLEGQTSPITLLPRIQALESLGTALAQPGKTV